MKKSPFKKFLLESEEREYQIDMIMESMSAKALGDELGVSRQIVSRYIRSSLTKIYWGLREVGDPLESYYCIMKMTDASVSPSDIWLTLRNDKEIRSEIEKEAKDRNININNIGGRSDSNDVKNTDNDDGDDYED